MRYAVVTLIVSLAAIFLYPFVLQFGAWVNKRFIELQNGEEKSAAADSDSEE